MTFLLGQATEGADSSVSELHRSTCALPPSDFGGKIYAFSAKSGKQLLTTQAAAGVNAFAAVTDRMLLVGAGTPGLGTNPSPTTRSPPTR